MDKRPTALQAVLKIANGCLFYKQLDEERLGFINNLKLTIHIVQRLVRLLLSPFLRIVIKHPLGWPLEQELLCTLMFGILQSRQVSAWRGFFGAVGELQAWVPVQVQRLAAGPCSAVWIRLPPEKEPQQPRARVNMVFFHGGAFVAGDALMYLGTHAYWLHKLAAAGISCSILSVDYPLAPEHPFPAAVEAAADVIEWLANESGETAPYILAGDSAGGNCVLTGLALLREQQRLAALQQQPEALLLLSPAVNMSDTSAFARGEPVSSHIDVEDGDAAAATGGEKAVANTTQQQQQENSNSSSGDGLQFASFSELKQQIQQHHHQQQHLSKQQQQQHQVGGPAGTLQLLLGLAGELKAVWSAHRSKAGAAAAAAAGWFDYLPGSAVADNIHHYLHDPALLCHPLVSPALLPDLSGLSQRGMMVVAGGAELMRPDIAAFAAKVKAAGVPVQYHEEPGECHCYALLALPHLLQKSHTVLDYIGQVALAAAAAAGPGLAGPAAAAAAGPAAEPAPAELQERESDTQSKL